MNKTTFPRVVAGVVLATAATIGIALSASESYPSRPITLIVPWGAGGGSDQVARAVAKILEDTLKTASVPVVNVPGADGNDGMVKLVSGDSDGYTLAVFVAGTFVGR